MFKPHPRPNSMGWDPGTDTRVSNLIGQSRVRTTHMYLYKEGIRVGWDGYSRHREKSSANLCSSLKDALPSGFQIALWTRSISNTWQLVIKGNLWIHPSPTESEALGLSPANFFLISIIFSLTYSQFGKPNSSHLALVSGCCSNCQR